MNEQTERISLMEHHLDQAKEAIKQLATAIEQYAESLPAIHALADYYNSDEWKKDFSDDEQGLLPQDLKRGVLSEDGIYNTLDDNLALRMRINEVMRQEDDYIEEAK